MAAPIPAPFGTVLLAIQAKIIVQTGLDPSAVPITKRDQLPQFIADKMVILRVMGETPDAEVIRGSGRIANRRYRKVRIIVRTRFYVDESDRDTVWMTDPALGHLALEDQVIDALEVVWIEDASSNALTFEPCRCGSVSEPKDIGGSKDKGWGESFIELTVPYWRKLSANMPGA